MWEAVRLTINDKEITTSGGLYPYKAYVSNLLTYDSFVKDCQLSAQGWYTDSAIQMEAGSGNDGFDQRNHLFRENFESNQPYRSDGASFFTRLHHDLITCESGLPPGTNFIKLNYLVLYLVISLYYYMVIDISVQLTFVLTSLEMSICEV